MNATLILFLIFEFGYYTRAQTTYRTVEGNIAITGEFKGERVVAQSSNLNFFLNYTTKVFVGKIDFKTLRTGVAFLDSLILSDKNSMWVNFSGTIPDDDFITWNHPVLKLNVPITVNANNIQEQLVLVATIEHSKTSVTYVCHLYGFVGLNISQFNFGVAGLKDTVNIQFDQLVLKRQL
nr:hypothetical protein [Bacteroidota bacterium]